MWWVEQRYRDVSPVTLQVVGGTMSSSLYCGAVEGLPQAESFLVELYRCKLCRFTCGPRAAIGSHLLLRHHAQVRAEPGLQRAESPYRLDLNGDPKQSDEDEDFLLYNMLDNMSPPTCDISTEEGLQVAHTCEVSTLFEEAEPEAEPLAPVFPLKGGAVDPPSPVTPPSTQEDMDQSAHLMTLGLCRISSVKRPGAAARRPQRGVEAPSPSRRRLRCPLCPLTLSSRRLLDVHVRSHRASGGFGCVRCSWTADSWEALEPHWKSHCRGGRSRGRKSRSGGVAIAPTDRRSGLLTQRPETKKAELLDRCVPKRTAPPQTVSINDQQDRRARLTCSLCHRKFSSKLTLKRHLGVHGTEKPFTCPHCPYSSRLKASLRQHLRTHTGEKPFRCSECPYASIDRSSLLRHSRTHSQEKPYRCQLCDYSSIQKKSLDLHARRHHTGEVFPCQQCEYSTPDRQQLLKHARRRHAHSQRSLL